MHYFMAIVVKVQSDYIYYIDMWTLENWETE
jgi:hypothetical protein